MLHSNPTERGIQLGLPCGMALVATLARGFHRGFVELERSEFNRGTLYLYFKRLSVCSSQWFPGTIFLPAPNLGKPLSKKLEN